MEKPVAQIANPDDVLKCVKLYTMRGELVTEIYILPFVLMPEGIMWGSRTFFWNQEFNQYREGLLWYHSPLMPEVSRTQ